MNLGLVYYAQSKFDDSARALSTAGKLRPGMRGVSLWLGIDEVRLNHPAQAVPALARGSPTGPTGKAGRKLVGDSALERRTNGCGFASIAKSLLRSFQMIPICSSALGEAYGKAARQQSEQLLEDSAGTAISDRIYAGTYAADHDWTKAEGHLRRAIRARSELGRRAPRSC